MPGAIPGTEVDCVDCVFFVFGKIFGPVFSEVMEMRYIFEIFFWAVVLFLVVLCILGRNAREIKWGECHVCLLDGELFAGELPPGAWGRFKDRNWQKICLNCLPHLENLMAREGNGIGVFTGGFGIPPPEYYERREERWMDEFGFDEAGNYIAGGWDPSDAENVHANDEIDWDEGVWDGDNWYAGVGGILLSDVHEMFSNDVEYVREEEEEDGYDLPHWYYL